MRSISLLTLTFLAAFLLLPGGGQTQQAAKAPAAAQLGGGNIPLNVQPGYWQTTENRTVSGNIGIPAGMAARLSPAQRAKIAAAISSGALAGPSQVTFHSCVKPEDLTGDPFTRNDPSKGKAKCTATVVSSTGSDMTVHETCSNGQGSVDMQMSFHAVDPQHVTGTANTVAAGGGHSMNISATFTSQWVGPTCTSGN